MAGKKANILTDNLGWILLALAGLLILLLAFPGIAERFENGLKFLRNWR